MEMIRLHNNVKNVMEIHSNMTNKNIRKECVGIFRISIS